ncbi:MAG: glutathione peroxidase [Archangium gephyra]|uniref:Glutathione peroxidase n=1 Tax=Archangium gephyra TaxID=48 RepID=A0A2W5U9C8_9BACT|nr:MAG: glutathione peroxidase [Archangium gephyra]
MNLYDIEVKTISGEKQTMRDYAGKTVLVVNVASKCGYTPQYAGLEALWKKYQDKGLVILGFPCDQFLNQEPGNEEEIQSFCQLNFGVSFPLFSKIEVNGDNAHPLFKFLKHEKPGLLGTEAIKWNFTKFLVDKNGKVVERFGPRDTPESIEAKIAAQLN